MADTLFLSTDELIEMTEYRHKAGQLRWLNTNGFPYTLDRFNRPKVLKETVRQRHGLLSVKTSIKWGNVA